MNDGDVLMLSPLSARGEQRLQRLRATIRQRFGSGAQAQQLSASASTARSAPASTASYAPATRSPRSRLRQRLARASQVSSDEIFFQEFGSGEDLRGLAFDLARTDTRPQPAPRSSDTFQSALPARSAAAQVHTRTPTKAAALKRARVGEGSAERLRQRPRLLADSPAAEAKRRAALFLTRASPSKLRFPSMSARALFAQRQAPLR